MVSALPPLNISLPKLKGPHSLDKKHVIFLIY